MDLAVHLIITQMSNQSGGGGGGGGLGFYQLNLSGTPFLSNVNCSAVNNPGITEYTVKEGDTVLGIAEAHGTTPEKIFRQIPG